jgi:hypothetical protein
MIVSNAGLCIDLFATSFSGTVKTNAGKPIRAAMTIHDLSTARAPGQLPFDLEFATKPDGTFTLANIPAGKYEFCVEAPQENILDPCIWNPAGAPTITVGAADNIANYAITVTTGYMLNIRVNDPGTLLPTTKSGISGDTLSLKVITAANRVLNFRLLSADSQGRNHYLLIPYNQALMVVTESKSLALTNGQNAPIVNSSQRLPILVPQGGSLPPITVNITGVATKTASPTGANSVKP